MMDIADTPRQGDLDGRGNLSLKALNEFILWFLQVCLDQMKFMESLFELDNLGSRFKTHVEQSKTLKPEATRLLEEGRLTRGQFERGEAARITGLPDRSARRVLSDLLETGYCLVQKRRKGVVSLGFPTESLDILFPRLFPQT